MTDERFGATFQYVLDHTPEGYAVPTLVEFSDPSGVATFEALGVGEAVHTTTDAGDAGAEGRVADTVPGFRDGAEDYGDVASVEQLENGRQRVVFESVTDDDATYFAEAPDGLGGTGRYEYGPVEVDVDGEWRSVGGTGGTVSVVGVGT